MKKLPLCVLLSSALFAIAGTVALARLAPRPEPFPLFFPLMWDLVMVSVGCGIVLRCDCARRAGLIWGVFCILVSLVIGAEALGWLWPQEPVSTHRMFFMIVAVGFGVVFGFWQLKAFNSPAVRAWTAAEPPLDPHAGSHPLHG